MADKETRKLGREIVYLRDFKEEADLLRQDYGFTRRFSTGSESLDEYLGGGYGRTNGYEMVLIFGPTKIGKSMIALNFLKEPITNGDRVGLLTLEDSGADVYIRMTNILGDSATKARVLKGDTVHMMNPADLLESWKLSDLLVMIEEWFTERKLDVILLDHLQFAFEGAEAIRGENEYTTQRIFMQKLNQLMKRINKTIILISHVNKDGSAKGTGKIVGSGSIAQGATKLIEANRDNGVIKIRMWGSRFTETPNEDYLTSFDGSLLRNVDDRDKIIKLPGNW